MAMVHYLMKPKHTKISQPCQSQLDISYQGVSIPSSIVPEAVEPDNGGLVRALRPHHMRPPVLEWPLRTGRDGAAAAEAHPANNRRASTPPPRYNARQRCRRRSCLAAEPKRRRRSSSRAAAEASSFLALSRSSSGTPDPSAGTSRE